MNRIIALLVIGLLTLGVSQASGQTLKDLMKKKKDSTEETTEEKAEEKTKDRSGGFAKKTIRSGVDKRLDKLFGTSSDDDDKTTEKSVYEEDDTDDGNSSGNSSSSGIGMNAFLSGIGMTGSADVKDVYKFDAYIEMTIVNYDSDGEASDPGKYVSYIDADSPDYGISFAGGDEDEEMLMIFDTENSLMLTLMESDGEKTGFAVAFTEDQQADIEESYKEGEENAETNPPDIKKTGKTKKILGYKCDEYKTEDETSIVSMWVTDDLEKKIDKTFMRNSNFSGLFMHAYYTNGFVMEYEIEEKDDHEKSIMTVTDIDVDNVTSIKTGGYTIMNMGAMEGLMEDEEEEE
jgi:hypothetical protein